MIVEVGFFLRYLTETLFFSSIDSFFLLFPFLLRTNVRWLEFREFKLQYDLTCVRLICSNLFCTSSHHNGPYEKEEQLNNESELKMSLCYSACAIYAMHWDAPERTAWRKYLEDCSTYIEIGTMYKPS